MNDVMTLLTDDELEKLDDFLLNRIPELQEGYQDKDLGILNISMLDGLFTAIVSSKNTILPSQWMPVIWGDYEPNWQSEAEAEEIISLLIRHMNGIVYFLIEEPDQFEPIFLEFNDKGKSILVMDDWCEGYRLGLKLDLEYWTSLPDSINRHLIPIFLLLDEEFDDKLDELSEQEMSEIQRAITLAAIYLHGHALKLRNKDRQFSRTEPKIGRNELCNCGSGLKYKKCCGKPQVLH